MKKNMLLNNMYITVFGDSARRIFKSKSNWITMLVVFLLAIIIAITAIFLNPDGLQDSTYITPINLLCFPAFFTSLGMLAVGLKSALSKELTLIFSRPVNRKAYVGINMLVLVVCAFLFALFTALIIYTIGAFAAIGYDHVTKISYGSNLFFSTPIIGDINDPTNNDAIAATYFSVSFGHYVYYITSFSVFTAVFGYSMSFYVKEWIIAIGTFFIILTPIIFYMFPLFFCTESIYIPSANQYDNIPTVKATKNLEMIINVAVPSILYFFSVILLPVVNIFAIAKRNVKI